MDSGEESNVLSNRSSIHNIAATEDQAVNPTIYETQNCKFIRSISWERSESGSKLSSTENIFKPAEHLNNEYREEASLSEDTENPFSSPHCSRSDMRVIPKKAVEERIYKLTAVLINQFNQIYEKCDGKLVEISFWDEDQKLDEHTIEANDYQKFLQLIGDIENMAKNFGEEKEPNYFITVDERTSVSPESGNRLRSFSKVNEDSFKTKHLEIEVSEGNAPQTYLFYLVC